MEGITGVVSNEDVTPGKMNYERFRNQMCHDVNAAIEGALEAGATEVVVNDSHGQMTNLLLEQLHPVASLISGVTKPLYMMEGIDKSFDCAMFVGYHSMVGGKGVLSHTMSGASSVQLNGRATSEAEINATIAGHFGVPVTMVSGDQYTVSEVREVMADVEGAIVKYAIDRLAARCLSPQETRKLIKAAAKAGAIKARSTKPYRLGSGAEYTFQFLQPSMAARAAILPFVEQLDVRTVRVRGVDAIDGWRRFWSALLLGRSAQPDAY